VCNYTAEGLLKNVPISYSTAVITTTNQLAIDRHVRDWIRAYSEKGSSGVPRDCSAARDRVDEFRNTRFKSHRGFININGGQQAVPWEHKKAAQKKESEWAIRKAAMRKDEIEQMRMLNAANQQAAQRNGGADDEVRLLLLR